MDKQELLRQMTLEEKIFLLQAKDNWSLNGVERFGIPSVVLTDGPSGVRLMEEEGGTNYPATALPTESILSSSWNTELVERLGRMLGEESLQYGVGILLGPGVNAKRSPLAGRNFEYFSEDPYLSGKMAAAIIKGVQSQGVGQSLKHYVANDQETRRFTSDATVDERTLREILLKPFEIAIKEAKPWTVMAAYPKLRGEHISQNAYVLKDILRDEYGYDGVVLTDWGACRDKAAAHKNGLDLETGSFSSAEKMFEAVESSALTEDEINEHVLRVLELIEKVQKGHKPERMDWDAHHELAREASAESAVLLKNENDLLPLTEGVQIAVIGAFAKQPRFGGGGSSGINPRQLDEPLACLSEHARCAFAMGYETESAREDLIAEACETARGKAAAVIFIGTTATTESEGSDRKDMLLPESHIELVNRVATVNPNVIVVNFSGSAVELRQIEKSAKAILHMGLCGEGGGKALADLLFGKVCPSGKLSETFPIRVEHTPAYPYFPGYNDDVQYHEQLMVGYRYYDTKKIPTQYPFGFGLSYTSFAYSNLRVSADKLQKGETLTVSVDVTNTGGRTGKEVVQFYVSDPQSYLVRPEKELKAFAKVELQPGETKTVTVSLDETAFAYYVPHLNRWAVESGTFIIQAAASAEDIRLGKEIVVESADEVRLPLTEMNTMGEFYGDDRYDLCTKQLYEFLSAGEDSAMFPILSGITLNDLPTFFGFFNIPAAVAEQYQKQILAGNTNLRSDNP